MMLVVGGTKEAGEAARILRSRNKIQAEFADLKPTYGENVSNGVVFLPRSLNCPMTAHLIRKYKIKIVIDAAPVYFKGASVKTMSACKMTGARYIRLEPPTAYFKEDQKVYRVKNIEEAREKAMASGETAFLNIGHNNINIFAKKMIPANKKIVVRVSETGVLTNFLKFGNGRQSNFAG